MYKSLYKKIKKDKKALGKVVPVKVVSGLKKRKSTNLSRASNTLPVLGMRHRVKLLYNDNRQLTVSGGVSNSYVFSCNGMQDVDITGGGHQPMGFDQLMLLYEHYTVTASKISVSFVNEDTVDNMYVGISLFPSDTVETTQTKLMENGLYRRTWLAPTAQGNPKEQAIVNHGTTIKRINGIKGSIVGDDLFRGDSATNPSEQTYYHVFAYNVASISAATVRMDVTIEYTATFTEPRKLAQS